MGRTCHKRPLDLLMVDDQSVIRALIRDFLQSSMTNLEIAEASDAARGMKILVERSPRVVLMDISLPDGNGIEVTARFKAARPETQVIVVTNMTGSAYVEHAFLAGASGFVRKDKIFTDLLPLLTRALHGAPRFLGNGDHA